MAVTPGVGVPGTSTIKWVESRVASEPPAMHKTAPTTESQPAQNTNSAKAEKSSSNGCDKVT